MDAKIHVSRLGGTATVPPSKSAAHRAVLCAALAEGTSHITNIEYSKDIRATLGAAAQLGAKITEEAHSVTIKGLKTGTYTVTEVTAWSWRHTACGVQSVTLQPAQTGTADFTNAISNGGWLSGAYYSKITFKS